MAKHSLFQVVRPGVETVIWTLSNIPDYVWVIIAILEVTYHLILFQRGKRG